MGYAKTATTSPHLVSNNAFSAARSFRFARRIAADINGATIREKPDGVPRFVSVIRVPVSVESHSYVVSIGNGPSDVRITSRLCDTYSTT